MDNALKLALLLVLLAKVYPSSCAYDFEHCKNTVKQWASSSLHSNIKDGHILKDLLFFLHVPRTGGRTYFYCKPNCRLLATHDDYSIMSKLPREKASVVTILRNPIDRVFSAYEFAIEVAARFLVHSNLTSATKTFGHLRLKNGVISTLEIWPWKYLVPWMREELFARRDARKRKGPPYAYGNDSYSMEEIIMPLHEFINHPVALDIVHNGATFQKRLDDMLYVGLTEDHRESATMFANLVGAQVISQLVAPNPGTEAVNYYKSEQDSSFSKARFGSNHDQGNNTLTVEAQSENMTVGKLMETYETCISKLRSSQSKRRFNSLRRISPANFTKEARCHVPEVVLKQITLMNSLDVELFKHGQKIFKRQRQVMEQKLLDSATPVIFQ